MSGPSKVKNGQFVKIQSGLARTKELETDYKAYFFVTPARARKMLAAGEVTEISKKPFVLQLLKNSAVKVYDREQADLWTNVSDGFFMNGIAINRRF
jgi:hypothetical protein